MIANNRPPPTLRRHLLLWRPARPNMVDSSLLTPITFVSRNAHRRPPRTPHRAPTSRKSDPNELVVRCACALQRSSRNLGSQFERLSVIDPSFTWNCVEAVHAPSTANSVA